MSMLTLADAKTHLNITGSASDTELQTFIDAAEATIVQRCGPLASTSTTSRVEGGATLVLPVSPALSLTSITPVGGTALSLTGISLYGTRGVVYNDSGAPFPQRWYDVVYSAGRTSVPPDLLFAVKETVRYLWETQRGNAPASGGILPDSEPGVDSSANGLLWWRVEQLIGRHEQVNL